MVVAPGIGVTAVAEGGGREWQVLVHEIPAKPLYLRAKVRTLLANAGTVAINSSGR